MGLQHYPLHQCLSRCTMESKGALFTFLRKHPTSSPRQTRTHVQNKQWDYTAARNQNHINLLYIVACQVHPALVKWSLVTRFYESDVISWEMAKGFRASVLSALWRRVLLETPPPWHATICYAWNFFPNWIPLLALNEPKCKFKPLYYQMCFLEKADHLDMNLLEWLRS